MGAGKGVWKVLACAVCGQILKVESPDELLEIPDHSRGAYCPSCQEMTMVDEDETPA